MGSKNKLKRFKENETFPNVIQPKREEAIDETFSLRSPEAYERLILDCIEGDMTNFTHWEEVAASWKYVDTIRQTWDSEIAEEFPNYAAGSKGPKVSFEMLEREGRKWVERD